MSDSDACLFDTFFTEDGCMCFSLRVLFDLIVCGTTVISDLNATPMLIRSNGSVTN